jgi:putative GTP pyrophosphokinase
VVVSKTQVDKLGERLRTGELSEADLRELDEYRRSFGAAYEMVAETIRKSVGLEPTGRPAKSTPSIVEKLQRETARLSQIQDIAGCRLIVANLLEQDAVVERLTSMFPDSAVVDRRAKPSNNYRAVHVIVRSADKLVEVQVRSELQHTWAELSEKLADVIDHSIKYGGGDALTQTVLKEASELGASCELAEVRVGRMEDSAERVRVREQVMAIRDAYLTNLRDAISKFTEIKGDVVSD